MIHLYFYRKVKCNLMKTLAILMRKGGSGKPSTGFILSVGFVVPGHSTVLLDVDPQASACGIADGRGDVGPIVQDCAHARLGQTMKAAADAGADICILDT